MTSYDDPRRPLPPPQSRTGRGSVVQVVLDGDRIMLTDKIARSAPLIFDRSAVVGLDFERPTRMVEGFLQLAISLPEGNVRVSIVYFGRRRLEEFESIASEIRGTRATLPSVESAVEAAPAAKPVAPPHPDDRDIAGCTVIGGYANFVPTGTKGQLQCRQAGVGLVIQSEPQWSRPYADLIEVEIGGPGTQQSGGGFIGGGFGVTGAVEGMIAASVLNALTTRTHTNSIIGLTALDSALILHTSALTPDGLRVALSPVIARVAAAKHLASRPPLSSGPTHRERLDQLTDLKDAGAISEEEYTATRQRIISEI
jgi:hypothetical protein